MKHMRKLSSKTIVAIVLGVLLLLYVLRAAMGGGWNPVSKRFWGMSMYSASMPRTHMSSIGPSMSGTEVGPAPMRPYASANYIKLAWVGSALAYDVYEAQNTRTGLSNAGYVDASEVDMQQFPSQLAEHMKEVGFPGASTASAHGVLNLHDTTRTNTNAVCFVLKFSGYTIPVVAFAGTKDWENWGTNTQWAWRNASTINPEAKGRIHRGFASAYKDVRNRVRDWCQKHASGQGYSPLLVCGHSLGSAISEVCAYDLALNGHQVAHFSLAPPRVGDADWVKGYSSTLQFSAQFTVKGDLVPDVGPRSFGFLHVPNQYLFEASVPCSTREADPAQVPLKDTCDAVSDTSLIVEAAYFADLASSTYSNFTNPLGMVTSAIVGGVIGGKEGAVDAVALNKGVCGLRHLMPVYLRAIKATGSKCALKNK